MFKMIRKKCKDCHKRNIEKALFKAIPFNGTVCPNGPTTSQLCNECWMKDVADNDNRNKNGGLSVVGDAWLRIRALDLPYVFSFIDIDSSSDSEDDEEHRRKKSKKRKPKLAEEGSTSSTDVIHHTSLLYSNSSNIVGRGICVSGIHILS